IFDQIQLDEQKGDLRADDVDIATYKNHQDGTVEIKFNDKLDALKDLEGTFVIKGEIEAEEEQATEEDDTSGEAASDGKENSEEKPADDESATDDNADESDEATEDSNTDKDAEDAGDKKSSKDNNKNSASTLADEEKHGFKLELDEILDLDDEAFDEQHPMDPHKEFKLKLNWELEDGHNYVAGDTETFNLPKGIKIKQDIEIELQDEHGQAVANAVIKPDKTVELTFTDFVEGHSAVSGWMEIISELDLTEVEEEDGEVIIDPIGEEGELRIPIEEGDKNKTIEKQGEPNKGYNADEINW